MNDGLECINCKEPLPKAFNEEPKRPCPKCGSTRRNYNAIAGTAEIKLTLHPATLTISRLPQNLLLQAVVVPGLKVPDGQIITTIAPAWTEIITLVDKDPEFLFKVDPRKLEEIIAGAYTKAGFEEVILTPRSGDGGRDVIAVKKGYCSIRIIEQVKRYGPNNLVTADEVRALVGVLHMDRQASKGLVTTTSNFAPMIATDPSIAPLIPYRLELVNGTELITRLTAIAAGHKC